MSILLVAAAVAGAAIGGCLILRRPDETKTAATGLYWVWRLAFIPLYAIVLYTIITRGGTVAIITAFIVTLAAVVYFALFRPDKKIKNFRRQG